MALKWKFATTWALIVLVLSTAIILFRPSAGPVSNPIKIREDHHRSIGTNDTYRLFGRAPLRENIANVEFDPNKFADDGLWNRYLVKGLRLQCLMRATDRGAGILLEDTRNPPSAASQWSDDWARDLETWYWHGITAEQEFTCDFKQKGMQTAFAALGLNDQPLTNDDEDEDLGGNNFAFMVLHAAVPNPRDLNTLAPISQQVYTVGNTQYTATAASYRLVLNEVDGAIIAIAINSPANSVTDQWAWNRPAAPGELPELRFLSDIMWGYWKNDAEDVKSLRVYIAEEVINTDTVLLVTRAFRNVGVYQLSEWPGVSFDADSDEGRAIIASPIGAALAWLLIQRKNELGIRQISKITICTNYFNRPLSQADMKMWIIFEIADVPQGQTQEGNPPKPKPRKKNRGSHQVEIAKEHTHSFFNESTILQIRNEGRDLVRVHELWGTA